MNVRPRTRCNKLARTCAASWTSASNKSRSSNVKTPNYASGLLLSCLLLLAACGSAPPSPEQTPIVTGCPAVTRCTLSATDPATNGELLDDQDITETDWAGKP